MSIILSCSLQLLPFPVSHSQSMDRREGRELWAAAGFFHAYIAIWILLGLQYAFYSSDTHTKIKRILSVPILYAQSWLSLSVGCSRVFPCIYSYLNPSGAFYSSDTHTKVKTQPLPPWILQFVNIALGTALFKVAASDTRLRAWAKTNGVACFSPIGLQAQISQSSMEDPQLI